MTAKEIIQLAEAKKDIQYMKQDIEEIKQTQQTQSEDIKAILERLDSLSGGKQALMYITGIFLTVAGLVLAALHYIRGK